MVCDAWLSKAATLWRILSDTRPLARSALPFLRHGTLSCECRLHSCWNRGMNVVVAAPMPLPGKRGQMAMFGEGLESGQWRIFRLFLVDLEDEDVRQVSEQLDKEQQARRDCELSVARLFFSSLTAGDLELARQAISNERAARAQERRTLVSLATGSKRRKPSAH